MTPVTSTSPPARRRPAPVVVRPMSSPREGWTLEDAVRMAEQGYRLQHVEKVTGWAAAQIRAQLTRRRG